MKTLTLYSRPDCHLCERLATELAPLIRGRASLRVVDIDEDLELKKRYGLRIPVLVGSSGELSAYPLDVAAVEQFLETTDG